MSEVANRFVVPEELVPVVLSSPEERRRQREVLKARAFHEGVHGAKLTERIREFLGLEPAEECEFSLNFCGLVTMAVAERLRVRGVRCSADNPDLTEEERRRQEAWANRLWKLLGLKARQSDLTEECVRDGEFYVVYDWDNENSRPRIYLHQRYTDPEVTACGRKVCGDGEGVRIFYRNGDPNQAPEYAVKRWSEHLPGNRRQKRLTVYYADRAVTYHREAFGWVKAEEIPWVDPRTGAALGIPVVEFYMPGRQPEAKRAWVPQRIVNKLVLDLLQIVDVAAFRIWVYFGWSPKDKDGRPLTIAPNRFIGVEGKTKDQASLEAVEGTDPRPAGEILDAFIVRIGSLTDTPTSRLITTRAIAAEGTLKQQSEPLFAKCRRRQENLESSWEKLFGKMRRLENAFGKVTLDPDVLFELEWEPIESRDAGADLKERQLAVQTQVLLQELGVSQVQSQRELGYSETQIGRIAEEKAAEKEEAAVLRGKAGRAGFGV